MSSSRRREDERERRQRPQPGGREEQAARQLPLSDLLGLQRSIGNRALQRRLTAPRVAQVQTTRHVQRLPFTAEELREKLGDPRKDTLFSKSSYGRLLRAITRYQTMRTAFVEGRGSYDIKHIKRIREIIHGYIAKKKRTEEEEERLAFIAGPLLEAVETEYKLAQAKHHEPAWEYAPKAPESDAPEHMLAGKMGVERQKKGKKKGKLDKYSAAHYSMHPQGVDWFHQGNEGQGYFGALDLQTGQIYLMPGYNYEYDWDKIIPAAAAAHPNESERPQVAQQIRNLYVLGYDDPFLPPLTNKVQAEIENLRKTPEFWKKPKGMQKFTMKYKTHDGSEVEKEVPDEDLLAEPLGQSSGGGHRNLQRVFNIAKRGDDGALIGFGIWKGGKHFMIREFRNRSANMNFRSIKWKEEVSGWRKRAIPEEISHELEQALLMLLRQSYADQGQKAPKKNIEHYEVHSQKHLAQSDVHQSLTTLFEGEKRARAEANKPKVEAEARPSLQRGGLVTAGSADQWQIMSVTEVGQALGGELFTQLSGVDPDKADLVRGDWWRRIGGENAAIFRPEGGAWHVFAHRAGAGGSANAEDYALLPVSGLAAVEQQQAQSAPPKASSGMPPPPPPPPAPKMSAGPVAANQPSSPSSSQQGDGGGIPAGYRLVNVAGDGMNCLIRALIVAAGNDLDESTVEELRQHLRQEQVAGQRNMLDLVNAEGAFLLSALNHLHLVNPGRALLVYSPGLHAPHLVQDGSMDNPIRIWLSNDHFQAIVPEG